MPTLLLSPQYSSDATAVRLAAIEAGWPVERLPEWCVADPSLGHDVVLYGESQFADLVTGALPVALLEPADDWLPQVGKGYLQRTVIHLPLADARKYDRIAFMKPANDKLFPAASYTNGAELPDRPDLDPNTVVLISDLVRWQSEYRCFVLDQQVVTMSPYFRDGEMAEDDEGNWVSDPVELQGALAFATRVLSDPRVAVPPAFVLDVGLIADGGWAVVEANPAWSSGIYGCDPAQVIRVLQRACLPAHAVTEADRRWVRRSATIR